VVSATTGIAPDRGAQDFSSCVRNAQRLRMGDSSRIDEAMEREKASSLDGLTLCAASQGRTEKR
jgi:hypothetical protein